ncbi:GNAT family N-acetyltransferase [soil metagenome]
MTPPTLTTERLILRPPVRADFGPFAAILASDRARFMGAPMDAPRAWRAFAVGVAQWALSGFGAWTVEERATAAYCGDVGLLHPAHYPEVELGWTLTAAAEGRGIAREAAAAARTWAFASLGLAALVSYIDAGNARSVRLAERLGAHPDPGAGRPDPEDLVYRHPGPEGRA